MIAAKRSNMLWTQVWLVLTGLLGLVFLYIEISEFAGMIAIGASPQRSAFLSAFFTLVGCHGLHVTCGLLWLGTMVAQIWAKGFQQHIMRRLTLLQRFLARPRYHLGGHLHHRLSDRDTPMTEPDPERLNVAPGEPHDSMLSETLSYVVGLGLALLLTGISFWVASTSVLWGPGVATGLVVLAIAQMGVHLVFFLHIIIRTGQHQQRACTRVRRADRVPGHDRDDLDHGAHEQQHGRRFGDDEPPDATADPPRYIPVAANV